MNDTKFFEVLNKTFISLYKKKIKTKAFFTFYTIFDQKKESVFPKKIGAELFFLQVGILPQLSNFSGLGISSNFRTFFFGRVELFRPENASVRTKNPVEARTAFFRFSSQNRNQNQNHLDWMVSVQIATSCWPTSDLTTASALQSDKIWMS